MWTPTTDKPGAVYEHNVFSVWCPTCDAPGDELCEDELGVERPGEVHTARVEAFDNACEAAYQAQQDNLAETGGYPLHPVSAAERGMDVLDAADQARKAAREDAAA